MDISLNISNKEIKTNWRSGMQPLMPVHKPAYKHTGYHIYPSHYIGDGKINKGFESLAAWIAERKFVAIDGYAGIFWDNLQQHLGDVFQRLGYKVTWAHTTDQLKPSDQVQQMVEPFLGTPNSVWGTKTTLNLSDFYQIKPIEPAEGSDITIVMGTAAALIAKNASIVYVDLPKNELQLRMRAGSITNLGADATDAPAEMYKRFYFVDWVVLNEHKKSILNKIDVVADGQWKDDTTWMTGTDLQQALYQLSHNLFRVRPWFEPGAWGGHWMRERIEGLNKDEVNYAWSFELIVPENGLVFESDNNLLEVSFDMLMFADSEAVMGKYAQRFGDEFPIRFDFLDTWEGGNLSIQCHPSLKYIRENFGETITQDETYYILDCQNDAKVYLGFQDNIDPEEFRNKLEDSQENGVEIDIPEYVQVHQAHKHDLFLIPNGTVHSAGAGNMVLEISATPYIFTFKMYDWLRLGLNGEPRAINIEHAFNNLKFDRKGQKVQDELISKQTSLKKGEGWEIIHVPTHADHFYDVERVEFDNTITLSTDDSCQVLMLVEGTSIDVNTNNQNTTFHYAETFVIPAAAGSFTMQNNGTSRAKVIKAFIKPYTN